MILYAVHLSIYLHLPTDCFIKISLQSTAIPVDWREIFMKQSVGECK